MSRYLVSCALPQAAPAKSDWDILRDNFRWGRALLGGWGQGCAMVCLQSDDLHGLWFVWPHKWRGCTQGKQHPCCRAGASAARSTRPRLPAVGQPVWLTPPPLAHCRAGSSAARRTMPRTAGRSAWPSDTTGGRACLPCMRVNEPVCGHWREVRLAKRYGRCSGAVKCEVAQEGR